MKCKAILLIAAMILTPFAGIISTTTVSTTAVSASPGGTAPVLPTSARAGTATVFTIVVTNNGTENIDNIQIVAQSITGNNFGQPITYDDNLKDAADNIENAGKLLKMAGENIKLAADNKANVAALLLNAASWFENVTATHYVNENADVTDNNKTYATFNFNRAGAALHTVATEMAKEQENENLIENQLNLAGLYMKQAAGTSPTGGGTNTENYDNFVLWGHILQNAGTQLVNAATCFKFGDYDNAGENIRGAGDNMITFAPYIQNLAMRFLMNNAGENLRLAGDNLKGVGRYIDNAGYLLQMDNDNAKDPNTVGGYLWAAAGNFENIYTGSGNNVALIGLHNAADNLKLASENIDNAGGFLRENTSDTLTENIYKASENLKVAANYLENVAFLLGDALGGVEENKAALNLRQAADNLCKGPALNQIPALANQWENHLVNLRAVGIALVNAGDNLIAAAAKIRVTATSLIGTKTWTMSVPATNTLQFNAKGDNIIAPGGGTQTFSFIWSTPVSTEETEIVISVLTSNENTTVNPSSDPFGENYGGTTLRVDGKVPHLAINVTQMTPTGVGPVNVAGNTYDNAQATITIVSNETLQSLGTVYVENSGGTESSFLTPILGTAFTTTDNKTYTYQYITIGLWDNDNLMSTGAVTGPDSWRVLDNTVVVRVASAKDLAGNENLADMENVLTVDTKPPLLGDNGMSKLLAHKSNGSTGRIRENVSRPPAGDGAPTVVNWLDNKNGDNLLILACDNINNADNGKYITSVTVAGTSASRNQQVGHENEWTVNKVFSQGMTSLVTVIATDRMGQSCQDNLENWFVDTLPPTVSFNTITKKTETKVWDENSEPTDDNKPTINITISDPGFNEGTGMGIWRENLKVILRKADNDNALDGVSITAAAWGNVATLDNNGVWTTASGVFENKYDNGGKGLSDGRYWIVVYANDNMRHEAIAGENGDNVIYSRSFIIDTTAPQWTTTTLTTGATAMRCLEPTTAATIPTTTKKDTWSVQGYAQKSGSTIYIYRGTSDTSPASAVASTTVDAATGAYPFSVSFTLSEGTTAIYFKEVDNAGNASSLILYGTYTVDKTVPTITLTAPADLASIDAEQVTVSGTITDKMGTLAGTAYDQMTVTIDATGVSVAKTVYLNADGSFSTNVPLVVGTNVINVVARDSAGITALTGNQAVETISVVRPAEVVTPWATYAMVVVIIALILAAIAIFRKK